ncbi:hypothetical protein NE619_17695 [Anaerovorax odorimutans]|uniref:Uncharacterized protein n=1 Tax=Anaerovorax odorimutans TaxID=109327 RepID=A0ABT1RTP2_9FIRM|nr:hypothetical protein [Anaerovorax odorimutans]MCQ4638565.1 hypothetical protein [Anaerovorax odorimutans]
MAFTSAKKKKYLKRIVIMLSLIFIIVIFLLMPFVIDAIYDYSPPIKFFDIELSKSDILDYYAQLLSLIATVILGVIAVVQTCRSQKKSEEINELQLSIARRELAVVEKQYADNMGKIEAFTPKFEIRITGYNGFYSNIKLEIKNISEKISAFRSISFDVYKNGEAMYPVKEWNIKFRSMDSSEKQSAEFSTPDMCDNVENRGQRNSWKNVKLVWKFSCDDYNGKKHYFAAEIFISNTGEFSDDYWEISKIG